MKKKAKKTATSRKVGLSAGASENMAVLAKAGVVIEQQRLSQDELDVIDSLSPEEVSALLSVYKKFSSIEDSKNPFWRAFCF
jgi:hypothetical protein